MCKIPRNDEATIEKHLIDVLGQGHNQWNYREDLKSEEDLWKNLRQKITQILYPKSARTITDKEFDSIK